MISTGNRTNTNRIIVGNARAAIVGATITTSTVVAANGVVVTGIIGNSGIILSSNINVTSGEIITLRTTAPIKADAGVTAPTAKVQGYMSGDGSGPNGLDVGMGIAFPDSAKNGDYFLRLDFVPNRLFRYDGKRWVKIEDAVRTNLTPGSPTNRTQRSSFVNNTTTFEDTAGNTLNERVSLSTALTPKADN